MKKPQSVVEDTVYRIIGRERVGGGEELMTLQLWHIGE